MALGAVRLPHVFDPLALYGLAVLASTVCLFHLAYSRYDDPAVRPLRSRPRHTEGFPPLTAQPRVSFLLAVHERAHIEACVRSMAAVDYPGLQLVVVDDASDDGTPDVLERLAEELPLTLIRLEDRPPRQEGRAGPRNADAVHDVGEHRGICPVARTWREESTAR